MSAAVPNNIIVTDERNIVIVEQDAPNNVLIRSSTSSSATRRHIHTQGSSSSTWVITHSLGGFPSVTVVDSANTQVIGEVQYDSNTQVTVSFTAAFSGFAYLT